MSAALPLSTGGQTEWLSSKTDRVTVELEDADLEKIAENLRYMEENSKTYVFFGREVRVLARIPRMS